LIYTLCLLVSIEIILMLSMMSIYRLHNTYWSSRGGRVSDICKIHVLLILLCRSLPYKIICIEYCSLFFVVFIFLIYIILFLLTAKTYYFVCQVVRIISVIIFCFFFIIVTTKKCRCCKFKMRIWIFIR
jgi:hypothetical protein